MCARKNDWPLIRKPSEEQIKNEHRFVPLSVDKDFYKKKESDSETPKVEEELREIVSENITHGEYEDLVDNFHWHIQHARRLKKFSPKQLGEAVAEPEIIISMAEKAKLPKDYDKLVSKLEQFLGISIRKIPRRATGIYDKEFDIKKANLFDLTTTDLRNLQMIKEAQDSEKEREYEKEEIELVEEDLEKE